MIRRPPRSTLFPSPTLSRSLPPPRQLVAAPRELLLRLEQLEPRCEPLFTCPGHVLRHRSSLLPSGSSPQPFDLLGQDAGEVLPAVLVATAHLVVGEPVVRQHQ